MIPICTWSNHGNFIVCETVVYHSYHTMPIRLQGIMAQNTESNWNGNLSTKAISTIGVSDLLEKGASSAERSLILTGKYSLKCFSRRPLRSSPTHQVYDWRIAGVMASRWSTQPWMKGLVLEEVVVTAWELNGKKAPWPLAQQTDGANELLEARDINFLSTVCPE